MDWATAAAYVVIVLLVLVNAWVVSRRAVDVRSNDERLP